MWLVFSSCDVRCGVGWQWPPSLAGLNSWNFRLYHRGGAWTREDGGAVPWWVGWWGAVPCRCWVACSGSLQWGHSAFRDPWWTACFFWKRFLFGEEQPWAIIELSTAGLGVVPGPGSWVWREPQGRRDGCPLCGALALSVAVEHRGAQCCDSKCKTPGCRRFLAVGTSLGFGATLSLGKSLCRPPGQRLPSGAAAQAPSWWRGSRAACLLSHWSQGRCVCSTLLPPEMRALSASPERPGL